MAGMEDSRLLRNRRRGTHKGRSVILVLPTEFEKTYENIDSHEKVRAHEQSEIFQDGLLDTRLLEGAVDRYDSEICSSRLIKKRGR